MHNPYFDAVKGMLRYDSLMRSTVVGDPLHNRDLFLLRKDYVRWYSWAIPDQGAVDLIARHAPRVVEIGAGGGYWAYLLKQAGVHVETYDETPYSNRLVKSLHAWHPVTQGDWTILRKQRKRYRDFALFLCWPPYRSDFPVKALRAFRGDRLIWVGEDYGGCTADDVFFELLDRKWECVARHAIPQWWGIHDYLGIYAR